jgi:NAD(P)-dependent dehydrogenase (short-subunit alcohol dehydrogenase family)
VHYNGSADDAEAVAGEIRAKGVKAATLKADLAQEDQVAKLVSQASAALGPLTGLVNNASLFENDSVASMTRASWDAHLAVNLRAPALLIQTFAKALPQDLEGAVVNLLDQRLLKPTPDFVSYGVSKAGLGWLTLTLAQALAPRIRVNAVAPGPTLASPHQTDAHFRKQSEATILGRGASPDDIADAACYLMGARAVTGQTITVDGGQHLIWRTPDTHNETELS